MKPYKTKLRLNDYDTFEWRGYKWIPKERWGAIHPQKPHFWYDPKRVILNKDESIDLETAPNVKYFPHEGMRSYIGAGLISCTEKFSYGHFSLDVKMPKGRGLWPAFWLWGWEDWPPEIDIFEGYSGTGLNYFKLNNIFKGYLWNIKSNVHWKDNGENKSIGGKGHFFGFKETMYDYFNYSLTWSPDYIKIFYDGKLVRNVKDKKILNSYKGHKMNVIINNGISKKYKEQFSNYSVMKIKNFSYKPL